MTRLIWAYFPQIAANHDLLLLAILSPFLYFNPIGSGQIRIGPIRSYYFSKAMRTHAKKKVVKISAFDGYINPAVVVSTNSKDIQFTLLQMRALMSLI